MKKINYLIALSIFVAGCDKDDSTMSPNSEPVKATKENSFNHKTAGMGMHVAVVDSDGAEPGEDIHIGCAWPALDCYALSGISNSTLDLFFDSQNEYIPDSFTAHETTAKTYLDDDYVDDVINGDLIVELFENTTGGDRFILFRDLVNGDSLKYHIVLANPI